jgi:microcin C transport system substrate-binding protein
MSMSWQVRLSRRAVLGYGLGCAAVLALGGNQPLRAADRRDAFSPLGVLKYPVDFRSFDYVNAQAPKGGRLRLARMGAFDTANTLTYPGRPAGDIRLIYDRLIVESDDEISSFYGLLARSFDVASDFSSIVFDLHDNARWHDGKPVRAEDVVFTFEILKSRGAPFYRQAFRTLTIISNGPRQVVFRSDGAGDRDIVRRIATIPIHPAHFWRDEPDSQKRTPLGSGPYQIESVDAPSRLVLSRVEDYWGADLGVNRGRWNFDRLVFDYFREGNVALEAFKADLYDVREEADTRRWDSGYAGPALSAGDIRRREASQLSGGTVHGIVFNLRRAPLDDRRVRLALTLAYDFDAVNRTMFGGAYRRLDSVFGASGLSARGSAGPREREIWDGLVGGVEPAVLDDPDPMSGLPPAGTREALALADRLLIEAGYGVNDGKRVNGETGAPLVLRLVSPRPVYNRTIAWLQRAWQRLGIDLSWGQIETAAATRRMLDRDFELATLSWSPARLPGTTERLFWHSGLADSSHSYALSGVKNPALDAAIEAMEVSRAPDQLQSACRAFDRAFRHALVLLPLWRDDKIRLAWWDRYGQPSAEEDGFPPSPMDRWWAA